MVLVLSTLNNSKKFWLKPTFNILYNSDGDTNKAPRCSSYTLYYLIVEIYKQEHNNSSKFVEDISTIGSLKHETYSY